ncbi:MAG: ABC transporter permease [Devosia sp.]
MNLALSDIRYKLGRFILTCIGLSLLLGIVIMMMGIFRGQTADALALPQAIGADLWVVESGSKGPFAEASRVPGDTREMVMRIHGVEAAGSITLQIVQVEHAGRELRLQIVGYEPGRPGGPKTLIAGRDIVRSHYELIADRQTGLSLGAKLQLGRRDFTVVGLTSGNVTASGDPVVYVTLRDAQELQFQLAPPASRRDVARGVERTNTDLVNAVIARVSPQVPVDVIADDIRRWKHLSALSAADQDTILATAVIERITQQLGLFLGMLTVVSGVIIALIVYTMTMDKVREIATLKLIGAPDRTIIGLIVQQALLMGVLGFLGGTALVFLGRDLFPKKLVLTAEDITGVFVIVVVVCLLASTLGVRAAVRVDPAQALSR